ncbi:MAG: ferrous iron transport protein A [Gemmataceae bacterium]|nr:ferrous iron transport protein A [Gemmataceae bacterium]
MTTLDRLPLGQRGHIISVAGEDAVLQRLLEMGLLEGEEIQVIGFAPLGDPMEILVCGYRLSLRKSEAAGVQIELL